MIVQIVLTILVVAIVLPVLLFAAAQRWATVSPRFGTWMQRNAARVSPRVGSWFADAPSDREDPA